MVRQSGARCGETRKDGADRFRALAHGVERRRQRYELAKVDCRRDRGRPWRPSRDRCSDATQAMEERAESMVRSRSAELGQSVAASSAAHESRASTHREEQEQREGHRLLSAHARAGYGDLAGAESSNAQHGGEEFDR